MRKLKDFIYEKGQIINDNNRNFTIIDRFINERISKNKIIRTHAYKCKCNICNHISIKMESDILCGKGCPCCAGKTVVEGINDIPTTASWMIQFFQGGIEEAKKYTKSSNKLIYPICPDCGRIKEKPIKINNVYNKKSIGCKCSYKGISYPERFMIQVLDQLNITYEWQFNPEWLCGRRFDFCIEQFKLIIETDGRLGHGYYTWGGGLDTTSKKIDKWKDRIAEEQGYKIIRIDCSNSNFTYIKENIVKSELKNYFDFSMVDFSKCEKKSLTNFCKEICLYFEKHKPITCKELSDIFNCATYTVTTYLKKGTEIGWCNYDVKEAQNNAIEKTKLFYKNNQKKSKFDDIPVISIDNNESMKYYESISIAAKIFDIRPSRIKEVCDHKKHYNTAGGYIWRYVDEVENNTLETV